MSEIEKEFRQSMDGKAAKLIEGMPPGEVADRLEILERDYLESMAAGEGFPSTWRNELILWLLNGVTSDHKALLGRMLLDRVLRILRAEVAELALAYATEVNNRKARAAQDEFYSQYTKMVQQHRQFRSFLFDHFPDDLKRAEADPRLSLVDLSITIMLRQKEALDAPADKH